MRSAVALPLALLAGTALGASCKSTGLNENHCASNDGDAYCASLYPDGSRPFCGRGSCFDAEDGCQQARPGTDECYSPCGGQLSFNEEGGQDCLDGGSGSATSGPTTGMTMTGTDGPTTMTGPGDTGPTTTDPTDTTGPMGCMDDQECGTGDPLEAFCVDDICTHCGMTNDGDAACASKYPARPVCDLDNCVQCTDANDSACDGTTPVCDTAAQECVACTEHAQCPDSACDFALGSCFPTDAVFYVDNSVACDDGGTGSMATPFCEIDVGVDAIASGAAGTLVVAGGTGYSQITILNKRVAILGDAGSPPAIQNNNGAGMTVSAGGAVIVDGLEVSSSNNAYAIQLTDGELWLDRCAVTSNQGGGIQTSAGTTLVVRNSLLANNSSVALNEPALGLNGGDILITYSTIANNFAGAADPGSLTCNGATGDIRNTIIAGTLANSIGPCAGITFSNNAVDTAGFGTSVTAHNPDWYENNFHLSAAGQAEMASIAQWTDGDPLIDIDGDPREQIMPSHPGWDQP